MHFKRGRDQKQVRRVGAQARGRKVALLLQLAQAGRGVGVGKVVLPHPHPVVEPLQGKVQIFRSLDFDHRQLPVPRDRQQIHHAAFGGAPGTRKGGHLGVDRSFSERRVQGTEIVAQLAAHPAFRRGAKDRVVRRPVRHAPAKQLVHQPPQLRLVSVRQRRLMRAGAGRHLQAAVERSAHIARADTRKLQAVQQKHQFGRRSQAHFDHRSRPPGLAIAPVRGGSFRRKSGAVAEFV